MIDLFRANIARCREIGGYHEALTNILTTVIDASDLLRAQHVLAVSALDHFVHESVRVGILEIFDGVRPPTKAFDSFKLPVQSFDSSPLNMRARLEDEIRAQHSLITFQEPKKIAKAIRMYSQIDLWTEVSASMGVDPQDLQTRIRLIVDRRNKIAHEADIDPSFPNLRWPIAPADVEGTVAFLEQFCESVALLA